MAAQRGAGAGVATHQSGSTSEDVEEGSEGDAGADVLSGDLSDAFRRSVSLEAGQEAEEGSRQPGEAVGPEHCSKAGKVGPDRQ